MTELLQLKINEAMQEIHNISGCTKVEADLVLALIIGLFVYNSKLGVNADITEECN
ncbi:hypothetical protein [Nodularia sp. NIES-3585]|uniref:hypothetical protein n=1 Tax=Nodularia sp. NIES-3585 TaxID=1973477 RepID=UPI001595AEE6|nr:hypothetical protein [Nodularia sp. NIES-3585]